MTSSFLHASSAKALASNSHLNQNNLTTGDKLFPLRMLLIEEDATHHSHAASTLQPNLAYSLVMDAAKAIVSSSTLSCRGCTKANTDNDTTSCSCCKVALLIPGVTKKSRKRRSQSNNTQQKLTSWRKIGYPINCQNENHQMKMNDQLLNQIYIKYIDSLSDLVKYLMYAPSLPRHLQPLDGICVLGLSDLLSRENATLGLTELIHTLSLLADTGDALEANRRAVSEATDPDIEHITVMATLHRHTYQSLPNRMTYHLHQWMDYVASIDSLNTDDTSSVEDESCKWELVVKTSTVFDSAQDLQGESNGTSSLFRVVNVLDAHHDLHPEIVWHV